MQLPIIKIISEKITGEWGDDPKPDSAVNVLRTTNFTNNGSLNLTKIVTRDIRQDKISKKKLIPGDTIIEKSGGSPKQPVGRVVFFDLNEGTYLCNNFTSIIRPAEGVVPKYLFYFLFYSHLTGKTLRYQNKTTGIINLQLDRYLSSELINLPDKLQQQKIVNKIDEADSIRKIRKESIGLVDTYIKSVFLEVFGDPINNPMEWDMRPLKDFGEIVTGNTPPRSDPANYSESFIEWIKTDNIVEDKTYVTKASEYLSEKGNSKGRFVEPGAVMIACIAGSAASIGKAALTDRRVSFNQQINAIQPNNEVNPIFLYWLVRISKKYILGHATSGMKKIITKGAMQKIVMILPPIEVQNDFAARALEVHKLKQNMLLQYQELDNHYQALLQRTFSSSIRK